MLCSADTHVSSLRNNDYGIYLFVPETLVMRKLLNEDRLLVFPWIAHVQVARLDMTNL